ncbi:MAG: hypothetical protein GWP27_10215 [Bacteroidetes bacterium]|nr:hypothetical protein [Bacteroidota bacterium]
MKRAPVFLLLSHLIIAIWGFVRYDVAETDVIQGDGYGYYSYLPGWFEHGDFYFEFFEELEDTEKPRYWLYPHGKGRAIPKMTMAMALYWMPFYLGAKILAPVLGYPADGWSQPFQVAVWLAGIIALIIGLWSLWGVLYRRFSGFVSTLTILLILLGTNLLHYSLKESSMSHVYSFAMIAVFIAIWDKWRGKNNFSSLIWMAIVLAIITMIRPTNIIVGILPLSTLMSSLPHRRQLLQPKSLILPLISILIFLPQIILWYQVTGDLLYYSYPGEQFFWTDPNILKGLFSYRNGWLLYTPIMALAIVGVPMLRKIDKDLTWSITAIFLIHLYIVFSWWCWYYGDSLSIRPMIEIYPFLSIPLAAFIAWMIRKRTWLISLVLLFLGGCLFYNGVLHIQYLDQKLSGSAMTKTAFHEMLFHVKHDGNLGMLGAYRYPDTARLRLGKNERIEMDTALLRNIDQLQIEDSLSFVSENNRYSQELITGYDAFETEKGEYLLIRLNLKSDDQLSSAYIVTSFDQGEHNYGYDNVSLGIFQNTNRSHEYVIRKPRSLPLGGELSIYVWQKGEGELELTQITLDLVKINYSEPL